jgi:hypothetical protein
VSLLLFLVLVSSCGLTSSTDSDEAALESLSRAGSDLSQPHPFDFYLYHRDQSTAQQMCNRLLEEGFSISLREGAVGENWLCLASREFVPSIDTLSVIQDRLAGLAETYAGEYDGWETL